MSNNNYDNNDNQTAKKESNDNWYEDLQIRGRVEIIQTTTSFKIDHNTGKTPGALERLAVTKISVKDHQQKLV